MSIKGFSSALSALLSGFLLRGAAVAQTDRPAYCFATKLEVMPCAQRVLDAETPPQAIEFLQPPPRQRFTKKLQQLIAKRYREPDAPFRPLQGEDWTTNDQLMFQLLGGQDIFLRALDAGLQEKTPAGFDQKIRKLFQVADEALTKRIAQNPFLQYGMFEEDPGLVTKLGGTEKLEAFLATQFDEQAAKAHFMSMARIAETKTMGRGIFATKTIAAHSLFCLGGGQLALQIRGDKTTQEVTQHNEMPPLFADDLKSCHAADYTTNLIYQSSCGNALHHFHLFPNNCIGIAELFNAPCTHTERTQHTSDCLKNKNVVTTFIRTPVMSPYLLIYTSRAVEVGEQLYRSYGEEYWKRKAKRTKAA